MSSPFVAGDTFSMADITVIGGPIFAALLPVPDACTTLRDRYGRMQERPSVRDRITMSRSPQRG